MRVFLTGIIAGAILCTTGFAQSTSQVPAPTPPPAESGQAPQAAPSAQQATQNVRIAPGSVIPVQLTKTVDAKKAKPGSEVQAKITQDMTTKNGVVVLAKETQVLGHVTEASARSHQQKESQLGIAFDRAVTQNGKNVALPMSIQAIIAPETLQPARANAAAQQDEGGAMPPPAGGTAGNSGGMPSGSSAGHSPGMTQGSPSQAPTPAPSAEPSSAPSPSNTTKSLPAITGNTKGVIGLSDLSLSSTPGPNHGSVVTSEKKNVKLPSGTFMLLRVTP